MFMGSNIVLSKSLTLVVRIYMPIGAWAISHMHEGVAAMIYS